MKTQSADLIVIGAGIAGLTAADWLASAGLDVLVLEARSRTGGRILTEFPAGHADLPAELGAEFTHGVHPLLVRVIEDAGLSRAAISGQFYRESDGALRAFGDEDEVFDGVLESPELGAKDIAFADFIDHFPADGKKKAWTTSFVEGFNAADARRISTRALYHQQVAENDIRGDFSSRVSQGYGALVHYLEERVSKSVQLMLETTVKSVKWRPGSVAVMAESKEGVLHASAKAAIVTVPIGVLQGRSSKASITFSPHPKILDGLLFLDPGAAIRLNLVFSEAIWEEMMPGASFVLSDREPFPVWWPRRSASGQLLTAWAGGPRAAELQGLSKDQLGDGAMTVLSGLLRKPKNELRSKLESTHFHDWMDDPFTAGTYSYVAAGGYEYSQQIAQPVENTLWFAGEAMAANGHWGTVHGAMESGLKAASEIGRTVSA